MRTCNYCGCENDSASETCVECGTAFPREETSSELPTGQNAIESGEGRLTAGRAIMVFLAYFAVQVAVGMMVGIAVVVFEAFSPAPRSLGSESFRRAIGPASFFAMLVSGIVMWLVSRALLRNDLRDSSPTGAAWAFGSWKQITQGLAVGLAIGVAYFALCLSPGASVWEGTSGPIATMAVTPGLSQWLWLAMALVFAPLIEELLFRGVVYGGFRKSLGPLWAAVWTTFIFVGLHVTEMMYYWPSAIGITGFAVAALWLRLRSAAVGPAVAVHFGYNAVVALAVFISTMQ